MPVEHSPKLKKPIVRPSSINNLQQYAFTDNQSPKRVKRSAEVITDSDPEETQEEMNRAIPNLPEPILDETNPMKLLKEILSNVSDLRCEVKDLNTKLNQHMENCNADSFKSLSDGMKNLETKLLNVTNIPANTNQIDKDQIAEDRKRRKEIPEWENLHFKRRDAFYACYRAEQEKQHLKKFIEEEPIYIPRKYRPKFIEGEPEKRFKIREKRSIGCIEIDIELKNDTIASKREEYENADAEIVTKIETFTPEESKRNELKDLWKKEIEAAEKRGKDYWKENKAPWWNNLKTKEPYLGFQEEEMEVVPEEPTDQNIPGPQTSNSNDENNPTSNQNGTSEFRPPRYNNYKGNRRANNDSGNRTDSNQRGYNRSRPNYRNDSGSGLNHRNDSRSRVNRRNDSQSRTTQRRDESGQRFLERTVQFHRPG